MRKLLVSAGFCLAFALTTALQGATINVGNHILEPNRANQQIFIYGDGGEPLQGMQIGLEILGDDAPIITNLVIAGANSGTLFGPAATAPIVFSFPGNQRKWGGDVATDTGLVTLAADLPLAIVTVDTTGIFAGTSTKTFVFDANPADQPTVYFSPAGNANFELFPIGNLQGSLSIRAVPEPSTFVMAGLAGFALVLAGIRRKRA
jgi:hypothetical protein